MEEGNSFVVDTFAKNSREAICVGLNEFKGKSYVFIRTHVPSLSGELIPTKKGISLDINQFDELAKGIKTLSNVVGVDEVVASIKKNEREEIRIGVNVYKDNPMAQIRVYAKEKETGDFVATPKGIAISVVLLPQLIQAIEKLSAEVAIYHKKRK